MSRSAGIVFSLSVYNCCQASDRLLKESQRGARGWRALAGAYRVEILLGAFERLSRERVEVPPAVVLLCPRAGAGMAHLKNSENLGGFVFSTSSTMRAGIGCPEGTFDG